MKRIHSVITLASLLTAAAFAQPPRTLIQDTMTPGTNGIPYTGSTAANGTITLQWPMFAYDSSTISQSPSRGQVFSVLNGAVSIPLVPTDHATSPTTYKVITTINGNPQITYWSVPTLPSSQCASSSFCTVKEVTVDYPSGPGVLARVLNFNVSLTYCPTLSGGVVTMNPCSSGGGTPMTWSGTNMTWNGGAMTWN